MLRADILTIFPQMISGYFAESMLRIAQEKRALQVHLHDIRDYTTNKHRRVDDRPFGGGPGMVMCCQPVIEAVRAVRALDTNPGRLFFMGPDGQRFDQACARAISAEERIVLVCGRYEGFDQRIFDILQPEILSIGDYVLTGGELAAAVIVDAVARLLPGVLGDDQSAQEESFSLEAGDGTLLDYPHYTQPPEFEGHAVPELLRGGHHAQITKWRLERARETTLRQRPDLLGGTRAGPSSGGR